jgi:hypothetical protein
MAQTAIGSPVNIYVKEGNVAISFRLHGELNVLVDTLQVVTEVPQPVRAMWPDDESVVHVTDPAEGLTESPAERYLLEVLHVEVGDNWRQWGTRSHTVSLFMELASETEV